VTKINKKRIQAKQWAGVKGFCDCCKKPITWEELELHHEDFLGEESEDRDPYNPALTKGQHFWCHDGIHTTAAKTVLEVEISPIKKKELFQKIKKAFPDINQETLSYTIEAFLKRDLICINQRKVIFLTEKGRKRAWRIKSYLIMKEAIRKLDISPLKISQLREKLIKISPGIKSRNIKYLLGELETLNKIRIKKGIVSLTEEGRGNAQRFKQCSEKRREAEMSKERKKEEYVCRKV
jgi:hypothetical protein